MKETHSLELLRCNLTYHKERIKNYSKPVASENKYIQKQLAWHIECKNDLLLSIELIKKAI